MAHQFVSQPAVIMSGNGSCIDNLNALGKTTSGPVKQARTNPIAPEIIHLQELNFGLIETVDRTIQRTPLADYSLDKLEAIGGEILVCVQAVIYRAIWKHLVAGSGGNGKDRRTCKSVAWKRHCRDREYNWRWRNCKLSTIFSLCCTLFYLLTIIGKRR